MINPSAVTSPSRPALLPSLARPAMPTLVPPPQVNPYRPARLRRRHVGLILSFLLLVVVPSGAAAWYLWARAADQYASYAAFSVRQVDSAPAFDLPVGLGALGGSSSADTDILHDYLFSQELVAEVDAALDLRQIWSKASGDPVFAYEAPGTIEDLAEHWRRKLTVSYDSATRLIELRVLAFDPGDAQAIARVILARSAAMINRLNAVAREDATRYARDDLARAERRLADARGALTEFRNRTQLVDPAADVQSQVGLLGNLQAQLAEAVIDVDLMAPMMRAGDLRLDQAQARVTVIEARIAAEREKLGLGEKDGKGSVYATLVGEHERLASDLAFAEQSQAAARAAFDSAQADARRESRYLAAHVAPTRAESARFPDRETLLALVLLFLGLGWSVLVLIYYALRDRR